MEREQSIEATKSKGPLGVAQQAKEKSVEKARCQQLIVKEEDVFMALPQPSVNEPRGNGRLMSISNFGFLLPQLAFADP